MNYQQKASQLLNNHNFDVIVNMMHDEICEQVHGELAPTTDSEFLERYIELHEEKFEQPFEIN